MAKHRPPNIRSATAVGNEARLGCVASEIDFWRSVIAAAPSLSCDRSAWVTLPLLTLDQITRLSDGGRRHGAIIVADIHCCCADDVAMQVTA